MFDITQFLDKDKDASEEYLRVPTNENKNSWRVINKERKGLSFRSNEVPTLRTELHDKIPILESRILRNDNLDDGSGMPNKVVAVALIDPYVNMMEKEHESDMLVTIADSYLDYNSVQQNRDSEYDDNVIAQMSTSDSLKSMTGQTVDLEEKSPSIEVSFKKNDLECFSKIPIEEKSAIKAQILLWFKQISLFPIMGLGQISICVCKKETAVSKKQKNHNFELTVMDKDQYLLRRESRESSREEKIRHNIDKNLLEFFTTKKFLENHNISGLFEVILRGINGTSNSSKEKLNIMEEEIWAIIEKKVISYFHNLVTDDKQLSKYYSGFLENKRKKINSENLSIWASALAIQGFDLAKVSNEDLFKEKAYEALKYSEFNLDAIIGEPAEQTFLERLFLEKDLLEKDPDTIETRIKKIFDESILENNIYKLLWFLGSKSEIDAKLRKLVQTRFIAMKLSQDGAESRVKKTKTRSKKAKAAKGDTGTSESDSGPQKKVKKQ